MADHKARNDLWFRGSDLFAAPEPMAIFGVFMKADSASARACAEAKPRASTRADRSQDHIVYPEL